MMISFIFFVFITIFKFAISYTIVDNISIQNSTQQYNAYIPYFDFCNYTNNNNIDPGNLVKENITSQRIFDSIYYSDQITFWGYIKDGPQMMINQNSIVQGYDGIIIYNSQVYQNLTRQLILYQNQNGTLIFTYAIPYVNSTNQNFQKNITQVITLDFQSSDISQLLASCTKQNLIIVSMNYNQLFCACKTSEAVFYWEIGLQSEAVYQQKMNIQYPIIDVASNPLIFFHDFVNSTIEFTIMIISGNQTLLSQNFQHSYFCNFTKNQENFNMSNMECFQISQSELLINNAINILWGSNNNQQEYRIQDVMQRIKNLQQLHFPGTITSVYVNFQEDLFIQCAFPDSRSYIVILKQNGQIYANISFQGRIVVYLHQQLIIRRQVFNNQTDPNVTIQFYTIQIIQPIYYINSSIYPTNYVSFQIPCQYNLTLNLQFNIFWSNIIYPSGNVQEVKKLDSIEQSQAVLYSLTNYFNIFGPAYDVFLYNKQQNIEGILLDSTAFLLNQRILGILDYIFVIQKNRNLASTSNSVPANNGYILYTTSKGLVKQYPTKQKRPLKQQTYSKNNPYFRGKTILYRINLCKNLYPPYYGHRLGNHYYFYSSQDIQTNIPQVLCQCNLKITICHKITFSQYKKKQTQLSSFNDLKQKYKLLQKKLNRQNNIYSKKPQRLLQQNDNQTQQVSMPKKYLIDNLLKNQLLLVIYTNNSVILTNSTTNQQVQIIHMNCSRWNATNGGVFFQPFENPILLVFCEQTQIISQYLIRKTELKLLRKIPIYGFVSRYQGAFFVGARFVFLQVDPMSVKIPSKHCCVLRLKPNQFTVSVIKQIIQMDNINYIQTFYSIDIAYYNSSGILIHSSGFIKIYYSDTILAINQTARSTAITSYTYQILFVSTVYNFAALYGETITFNLTLAQLSYSKPQEEDEASLILPQQSQSTQFPGLTIFTANMSFDYNDVCGPIQSTSFNINSTHQKIQIVNNQIVTPSKILGKQGQQFIQILDLTTPQYVMQQNNLNNLLLLISGVKIYVYAKQFNNTYMQQLQVIYPPQTQCQYILYNYVNSTCGTFITTCQIPNFHYKTPYLILNYENGKITYQFQVISLPINLLDIYIIQRQDSNQSYIVGIAEGPTGALTGKLFFCAIHSCSSLYLSSKQTYLVSYDAQSTMKHFVIMSLDGQKLQVWIDLENPIFQIIQSNYTIYLKPFISTTCTQIKLIKTSKTSADVVLSSQRVYYYATVDYIQKTITIISQFVRYINCVAFDQFKPKKLRYSNYSLRTLITECSQKRSILRLEEVQNINQSSTNTYTGYLQIFSFNGPQCGQNVYQPIKIVPLSSQMKYNVFQLYNVNNSDKLIYQKISGILFDNFLNTDPYIFMTLMPFTKVVQLPNISMSINNQYYSIPIPLNIVRQPFQTEYPAYIFLSFLALFNVLTIIMVILWFCIKYSDRIKKCFTSQKISNNNQQSGDQTFIEHSKPFSSQIGYHDGHKTSRQVSQIQLFSHKLIHHDLDQAK